MGQIYYDFAQGLNFIDPNGFNTTIFWDEITIRIKETNLTLTLLRIVDVGITLFGISQHLGNKPLKLQ